MPLWQAVLQVPLLAVLSMAVLGTAAPEPEKNESMKEEILDAEYERIGP